MSVNVEAIFDDKEYIVEVFENADIVVHGYSQENMDYDLSMVEFGENESQLLLFIKYCEEGQKASSLVGWSLDRKKYHKEILLFGIDCVQHAAHECIKKMYPTTYDLVLELMRLSFALVDSHSQFPGGNDLIRQELQETTEDAMAECDRAEEWSEIVTEYILRAAISVASCARILEAVYDGTTEVESMFSLPVEAVGFAFEGDKGVYFEDFKKKEDEWQIKRFVECMKSVQAGHGWPPFKWRF
jgi:hypothetical protein